MDLLVIGIVWKRQGMTDSKAEVNHRNFDAVFFLQYLVYCNAFVIHFSWLGFKTSPSILTASAVFSSIFLNSYNIFSRGKIVAFLQHS